MESIRSRWISTSPPLRALAATAIAIAVACGGDPANGTSATAIAPSDLAEAFVRALDDNDLSALTTATGLPFQFREQTWATATDGSGFVLGQAEDRVFEDRAGLSEFLRELTTRVKIHTRSVAENPPPKSTLLSEELKGAPASWAQLDIFVFLRGMGDVEHIALVGVDPVTQKVAALYVN